jgi:branched-chain amino acid transport system substrate-binding protein
MTADGEARTMGRGDFIKLAGAAGLAVVGPLAAAERAHAATSIALKVGVITSTGASYAGMGQSLLDGLHLGFDHARSGAHPVAATLTTATVLRGYGGALTTARELLDGGADVVVANVSAPVAQRLTSLFAERHASLVVADVGAHVVQPAARNRFVLHNSLLYWHASFALGQWAAVNLGKRGFVAASLSDAGYDTVFAFRRGFQSAGGSIVGDGVTHVDPAHDGLSELFAAVQASRANVLYGLYSGAHAVEFVQAYARSGMSAKLAMGSLGVEDYLLGNVGSSGVGVTSSASWTATRTAKVNQSFTKAFEKRYGRSADPFAALGYDTASLVAQGASRAVTKGLGLRRLIEALSGVSIDGPRGMLTVDTATNTVTGPLFVRQVKHVSGRLANYDIALAPRVGAFPHALAPLAADPASGYINEYLCA